MSRSTTTTLVPERSAPLRPISADRPVALWLLVCCAMIFCMVVIGGITRLTESGLSITQWEPIEGVVPPLSTAQWQSAFADYQAIPQYRAIHADMTLSQFKGIFFWEYLHRLWGRLIGLAFAAPLLYFLLRRRLSWSLAPRLFGLFGLGGLQGALGWYMVESGLANRIEVSQYRLAAHLAAAVVIYIAMLWVALDLLFPRRTVTRGDGWAGLRHGTTAALCLVFVTLVAGSFVAGLRAGYIYNTFPLMNGTVVPPDYWHIVPWWRNWFETPAAAQFDHRLLAETSWVVIAGLWLVSLRVALSRFSRIAFHALFAMATVQVALGISTLLLVVPLPLAVLHQAGAILLLTTLLFARHALSQA